MRTRRAVLWMVGGCVAGLAGCTGDGTTGDETPLGGNRDDDATAPTTAESDQQAVEGPIDLVASAQISSGADPTSLDSHSGAAGCHDYLVADGSYYRTIATPTLAASRACPAVVPTHRLVIEATATPLRPSEFPSSTPPPAAESLSTTVQSMLAETVDSGGRLVVAEWQRYDDRTLEYSDAIHSFLTDGPRYARRDGTVYLFRLTQTVMPDCHRLPSQSTYSIEAASEPPSDDDTVVTALSLSTPALEVLQTAAAEWVVTRRGEPPADVRTVVDAGTVWTAEGPVSFVLTDTGGGYRLAAVRRFDECRPAKTPEGISS